MIGFLSYWPSTFTVGPGANVTYGTGRSTAVIANPTTSRAATIPATVRRVMASPSHPAQPVGAHLGKCSRTA